jgi:hypothetical protein
MERDEESTKEISRLYYGCFDVEEAIILMRHWNISAEVVKNTYNQLSIDAKKSMTKKFHYSTIKVNMNDIVRYWTSRYLLAYDDASSDPAFHEIKILIYFKY